MNPMTTDRTDEEELRFLACFALKNEDLPDLRRNEERITF